MTARLAILIVKVRIFWKLQAAWDTVTDVVCSIL